MNKLILLLLLLAAAPARAAQTIVTLGFDDGTADHMNALSILDSHGLKGTFYVNSQQLGTSSFYLTRAQLAVIAASGHEIAGHTLTHAHLTALTPAQAQTEICGDRALLQSFGYSPVSFAYPYGEYNASVRSTAISCGYDNARGVGGVNCTDCPNSETQPPLDRFVIRSVDSFKNVTTLAQMQKVVTDAENSGGGWVPLVLHRICNNCDTYSTPPALLTSFLDWLAPRSAQGTIVRTNAQVMSGSPPPPPPAVIASLSPSTAAAGGAAFTLSVNGSGFVSGATVAWNGSNRTTTFVSAALVQAAIPAADIAAAGTRNVTVANPGSGPSAPASFTIAASTAPPPPPPANGALLTDSFDSPNGLITNEYAHFNPGGAGAVISSTWDLLSGSLFADAQTGWTGVPDYGNPNAASSNFNNSSVFQAVTKSTGFGDVSVYLTLTHQGFVTTPSTPAQGYDGVHVLLRRSASNAYYYFSANRRDNTVVVKKQSGGTLTTLASAAYAVPFSTAQRVVAEAQTQTNGSVLLRLTINGVQKLLFTDAGTGGGPLTAPGAVSIAGNNSNFRFDDFSVMVYGAVPSTAPAPSPVPALASISPSSAAAGSSSFTLTAAGAGFTSASTVRWNGADRPTVFVSSSQLTASIPASDLAAASASSVTVFTGSPGGGTSTVKTFLAYVPNPVPTLVSINAGSAAAGSSSFTLTALGAGFVNGSKVRWNGADRATVFLSSAELTAVIPSSDLSAPSTAFVTVFTGVPGGGTSTAKTFVVFAPNPLPALAGISPSSAEAGGSSFTLTVDGGGFTPGSIVRWNGEDRETLFVSTSQLTASALAGDLAAPGTAAVTVFTPAPGGGTSTVKSFLVYVPNPLPALAGIDAASAAAGSSSFTLTAFGNGFVSGTKVRWNGADRATVFISSGEVSAVIPASDLSAPSTAFVTVFSPGPGGGTSNAKTFLVYATNPIPVLAAIDTASAAAGSSSFTLTAFGDGFVSGSTVRWNGDDRATVFISSAELTAVISAADLAAPSTSSVTVFSPGPGGGLSSAKAFLVHAVNPLPVLAAIDAASAAAGSSSFTLTALGDGFVNGSKVRWNGADRATVFVSGVELAAVITASDLAAPATAFVTVFSPGPGGGTSTAKSFLVYAVNPLPSLSGIAPSSAALGGSSFTLTVDGGGFTPGSIVRWNGEDRETVFVSGAQLTASALEGDLAAPGTAAVTVFTPAPGGGTSTVKAFLVYVPNPAPTLASIDPGSAIAGSSSFTLTAHGGGFVSGSKVHWNGAERATVFVSSSELTAAVLASDLAAAATAFVTVFSPGPGGGTSTPRAFVVLPPPPGTPALASISPSSAAAGSSSFTLAAFGSGFAGGSTVRWNGEDRATVFVSTGRLDAVVLAADLSAGTTAVVTVFTPAPGGGTSTAKSFLVYVPNPLPELMSISPSSASAGSSSFTLTALGAGFVNGSLVRWNGLNRTTVFVSSAELAAVIPASDLSAAATSQVTVFSPGPGGGTSTARAFVVSPGTAPAALFSDGFNRPNALITNEYAYYSPAGPGAVISATWTVTAGSFFVDGNTAWTGVPDAVAPNAASSNGTGSAVLRVRTKRADFGDVSVSFTLTNLGLVTTPTTPAQAWDGVNVALRYLSENSYYYFTVNRRDNTIVLKKKSGTAETFLASAGFAVPYNTAQSVQASVKNNPNGSVALTLTINGVQRLSVADASSPLASPGAIGLRGNNDNFRIDDFSVAPAGGMGPAELISGAVDAAAAAATLDAFRVFPNPWRADRHGGTPLRIDGLTDQSEVRFYTVAGRWVRTIAASGGAGQWDLNNDAGSRVASGLYLYLIKDAAGGQRRGVVAVIR